MNRSIRHIAFTWNPASESRSTAWQRIKQQVLRELDAINDRHRQLQRLERYRARQTQARDARITADHDEGVTVPELSTRYELPRARVREILRKAAFYRSLAATLDAGKIEHATVSSFRQLDPQSPWLQPTTATVHDP